MNGNEKVLLNVEVPTGNICILEGKRGFVEVLSIGDYGKNANIKADFLGLSRDIDGVPDGECEPLEEKWVITLSTQTGCSQGCLFCDVPNVGPGRNATYDDLKDQLVAALKLHPEVKFTKRLNVHFARMGEPSWNPEVLRFTRDIKNITKEYIGDSLVHPVFTTMSPKTNKLLVKHLQEWCEIKNEVFDGDAGLQLSINSTCNDQRNEMFSQSALSIEEVSEIGKSLPKPKGRKYALNIALADDYIVEPERLKELFDPENFMVKITPLHTTDACEENDIVTTGGYYEYTPYKETEEALKAVGFDVLVFIPSIEEDVSKITCGNVLLSNPQFQTKLTLKEMTNNMHKVQAPAGARKLQVVGTADVGMAYNRKTGELED